MIARGPEAALLKKCELYFEFSQQLTVKGSPGQNARGVLLNQEMAGAAVFKPVMYLSGPRIFTAH